MVGNKKIEEAFKSGATWMHLKSWRIDYDNRKS